MSGNSELKTQIEEEIAMLERLQADILNGSTAQFHYYKGQIFAYRRMLKTIDAK